MPAAKSAISLLALLLMANCISSCSPAPRASLSMDPVQEATSPQGAISVTVPGHTPLTQPPVTFSHQTHAAMNCEMCHHEVSGDSMICCNPDCHATRGTSDDWHSFRQAYHARKGPSCMNCHLEEKEYGTNKNVPTACGECHKE